MSVLTLRIGERVYRLQELAGATLAVRAPPGRPVQLLVLYGGHGLAVTLDQDLRVRLGAAAGRVPIEDRPRERPSSRKETDNAKDDARGS